MKAILKFLMFTGVLFCLVGCDKPNSQSGSVAGVSYHAFWQGNYRTAENLSLLVIADYTNEDSPAKGQRLYGVNHEPVLSGYFDRDGEIVSFALLQPNSLQILDKYLPVGENPIARVYRDVNGLLAVELLRADSPQAKSVIEGITENTEPNP